MTFARHPRARLLPALVLAGMLVVPVVSVAPVAAAPNSTPGAPEEGGSASLTLALENASRGYTDAKAKLEHSRQEQGRLAGELTKTQARVADLTEQVSALAGAAYRGGRPSLLTAAVDAGSFGAYLGRARIIEQLAWENSQRLRELRASRAALDEQRTRIDAEARTQIAQRDLMSKRKLDAERALGLVGGGSPDLGVSGEIRLARAAPRAPDGSWPHESCDQDDPTTSRCVTPRMLHAFLEARAAGFQRYTNCNHAASFGEHGKGRACDFAVSPKGFAGVAAGDERVYGNRLAAFFIKNSDRLGVLYVIWFRRIWMPGIGWTSYSGRGSPSAEHTNHVHLSVQ